MLDFKRKAKEESKNGSESSSGSSFEEIFMSTFTASYTDIFDTVQTVSLKEGGENIPVTPSNCEVMSTGVC